MNVIQQMLLKKMLAQTSALNRMVLMMKLLMKNPWQLESSFSKQSALGWQRASSQLGEFKTNVKALKENLEFFWLGFVRVVAANFLRNGQAAPLRICPSAGGEAEKRNFGCLSIFLNKTGNFQTRTNIVEQGLDNDGESRFLLHRPASTLRLRISLHRFPGRGET